MHSYLNPISEKFTRHSSKKEAESMKAYLLHQFSFHGIKTPQRRELSKAHYKQYPVNNLKELESIVTACFEKDEREYLYFGVELFAFNKKLWEKSSIKLIEHCLITKSWWDSVDHIASEWLDTYFKLFPEQIVPITGKWNRSSNMWLLRSSIMFQKKRKKDTDTKLLSAYILRHATSKEFFIQKAIGWALREYSKTDPVWVKQFVAKNKNTLAPLSQREALKRI